MHCEKCVYCSHATWLQRLIKGGSVMAEAVKSGISIEQEW